MKNNWWHFLLLCLISYLAVLLKLAINKAKSTKKASTKFHICKRTLSNSISSISIPLILFDIANAVFTRSLLGFIDSESPKLGVEPHHLSSAYARLLTEGEWKRLPNSWFRSNKNIHIDKFIRDFVSTSVCSSNLSAFHM